ncbi:hypothetical protein M427DRAFT_65017 [Gonapodya prolifera JEL478]|uniref:Uncharacterized protein n=1 Tax=Gonapodya prolifera (strain JEL478) TaxID=1344416 RepID=A0A138ZWQ4_GONPJ|nr:hypothetical protein M427DRAFT_65017 [Gonapodya prolifera JEL478]|eukprot:KXS08927.1 hypothetical protein M427DRAFT_65017 [Gonapodya prolifera JEL478]
MCAVSCQQLTVLVALHSIRQETTYQNHQVPLGQQWSNHAPSMAPQASILILSVSINTQNWLIGHNLEASICKGLHKL